MSFVFLTAEELAVRADRHVNREAPTRTSEDATCERLFRAVVAATRRGKYRKTFDRTIPQRLKAELRSAGFVVRENDVVVNSETITQTVVIWDRNEPR